MQVSAAVIKSHEKDKIKLLDLRATFFASIVYSLKLEWTENVPTAGVNLTHLYINPAWYEKLDVETRAGLLCHEAMHVALDHLNRCTELKYDKFKYNIAADYVINNHLDREGFRLPTGGLINHQYDNKTTEQVYKLLPKTTPPDFDSDLLPNSSNGTTENKEKLKEILVRAKIAAEMDNTIDNVPEGILRNLDELINPVLDWKNILDKFLQEKAKIDYTWFKPNRRFFPEYYLPSLDGVSLGHICVSVDLSGSITKEDLQAFLSEIYYIYSSFNPERLTIIGWDTKITDIFEITDAESIKTLKFTGGGGTDISALMKWVNKNTPLVTITFTDGAYNNFNDSVESSCLFIIKDNPNYVSNIGETIHYAN